LSKILFQKTLIIGLGLIGGSFAKTLRKNQLTMEIFAVDFDQETIDLAKADGVIDGGFDDLELFENDLKNFDFIVLATPISAYEEILENLAQKIAEKTIIIDLGSIKNLENLTKIFPENLQKNFIFCHPIAGSEKDGFENSSADLFAGKKFIICPENSDKNHLKKIEDLAKKIGSIPDFIDAETHDEIYALVSHLPQFLSFLTKEFSPKNIKNEFFKTAFRLDDSDPEIWSDIFKLNEKNLEKFYLKFFDNLEKFEENLQSTLIQNFKNTENCSIDEKFLEENFVAIFFRLLVVLSFLKIPQIKTFENFAGSGFVDFTSITKVLDFDQEKLKNLLIKNNSKILKLLSSLNS
jgi:prephenate dehydrogenase